MQPPGKVEAVNIMLKQVGYGIDGSDIFRQMVRMLYHAGVRGDCHRHDHHRPTAAWMRVTAQRLFTLLMKSPIR